MAEGGIHQVLEMAMPGDAIFNLALAIRDWVRARGFQSEILSHHIAPGALQEARPFWRPWAIRPQDLLLYHFGLSGEATGFVKARQAAGARVILYYHNVTPPEFYKNEDPVLHSRLLRSREELGELAKIAPLALTDSNYNASDLYQAGFKQVAVAAPVLLDERWKVPPDPRVLAAYRDGKVNLLFVGRITPSKRQEDLIKILYYCQRLEPNMRLLLVGHWGTTQAYYGWLQDLTRYLGLKEVVFSGHVSQAEVNAYYQVADVFVSMSEHEGFGVPLVESMYMGVPVIAYDSAAVAETIGEAGILIKNKDFPVIAELIHLLLQDKALRGRLIENQKRRAETYSIEAVREKFWESLSLLR